MSTPAPAAEPPAEPPAESAEPATEQPADEDADDQRNPQYSSHEAFAFWFDSEVRSLEDIETAGEDFDEVMIAWCAVNNHEYRADGVYNMNIHLHATEPAPAPAPEPAQEEEPGPDPRLTEPFIPDAVETCSDCGWQIPNQDDVHEMSNGEYTYCDECYNPVGNCQQCGMEMNASWDTYTYGRPATGFRDYCRPCGRNGDPDAEAAAPASAPEPAQEQDTSDVPNQKRYK
jgi:hypothetical protein